MNSVSSSVFLWLALSHTHTHAHVQALYIHTFLTFFGKRWGGVFIYFFFILLITLFSFQLLHFELCAYTCGIVKMLAVLSIPSLFDVAINTYLMQQLRLCTPFLPYALGIKTPVVNVILGR